MILKTTKKMNSNKKKIAKAIPIIFMIILFSNIAFGIAIGVSPSVLNYKEVLKGGYAMKTLLISTDTPNNLIITVEKSGEVADWISFEPIDLRIENITVTQGNPYLLNVIVQPPEDIANGNYTGYIRVITDRLEDVNTGKGAAVRAAFMVNVNIEITGKEIVRCVAGGIYIPSIEIGQDLALDYTLENTGNVRIRPDIFLDIMDNKDNKVTSFNLNSQPILPTLTSNLEIMIGNELKEQQYFAEVSIPLCGIKKLVTFDVVEPGGIRDEGELVKLESASWSVTGKTMPITGVFKNIGERSVRAKFIGTITDAKGNVIKVIDTDPILVKAGDTQRFQTFFKPSDPGQYFINGKVNYNDKLTFEKVMVININIGTGEEEESAGLPWGYIIFFLIIIALLLIIIKKKKIILRRKSNHHHSNFSHHKKKRWFKF